MKWLKEANSAPVTDPKEMDIYKLSDEESRMILLKKFSELQKYTNNTKIKKTMNKWENINKMRTSTKK